LEADVVKRSLGVIESDSSSKDWHALNDWVFGENFTGRQALIFSWLKVAWILFIKTNSIISGAFGADDPVEFAGGIEDGWLRSVQSV